jgi:hypothetical protein
MLSPLPRRSDWASSLLIRPVVSAFPDRVVGSACASTFSRFARRSLTLRPAHSRCHQFVTRITEGFSHFVTSIAAPVASGWSGCRVGLAPTGKRHLLTAHTHSSRSTCKTVCLRPDIRDDKERPAAPAAKRPPRRANESQASDNTTCAPTAVGGAALALKVLLPPFGHDNRALRINSG